MSDHQYCAHCGAKLEQSSQFCAKCGTQPSADVRVLNKSDKSPLATLLLCLFLGSFGIHRFYVGKIGTGFLMLITAGGFGIWTLIDLIRIACSDFTDSKGNYIELMRSNSPSYKKILLIVGVVLVAFLLFVMSIIGIALYATSGVVETVRGQLSALRTGDYLAAYTYTSKDFQNSTSFTDFQKFVNQYPALKNNKDSTFTHREIRNSNGFVSGTIEAINGTTTPIRYRLIKEKDHWKILSITINPSDDFDTSKDE